MAQFWNDKSFSQNILSFFLVDASHLSGREGRRNLKLSQFERTENGYNYTEN